MSQDGFSIPPLSTGNLITTPNPNPNPISSKRKRNLPGTPDPEAEVISMSPKSLMATNRFMCEICNKGFQRDQNLQLHRRGHNLPWKLKQRSTKEIRKKVYICPEKSCVHHDPSRALGDLTGIKKHYSRKHGEKKWKCEKCSKKYAVQSDWKAHSKICGTREYRCDCGTLFSRKDSFITHRAFCDALAEESARFTSVSAAINANYTHLNHPPQQQPPGIPQFSGVFRPDFAGPVSELLDNNTLSIDVQKPRMPIWLDQIGVASGNSNGLFPELVQNMNMNMYGSASTQAQWLMNKYQESTLQGGGMIMKEEEGKLDHVSESITSLYSNNNENQQQQRTANMSATALLQKAAQMGSTRSKNVNPTLMNPPCLPNVEANNMGNYNVTLLGHSNSNSNSMSKLSQEGEGNLTRDFLGVGGERRRPFLQEELANYAGIDLRQYNNSGHNL
ncbi:zinc finger protein BALDIBIS-like [Euphorbia lathyris]|uniref:zinc finger protein BALDIBIS-like n=1 Tax=Euphorbia lathyris TaxID=212925 RepID=UPI003313BCE4